MSKFKFMIGATLALCVLALGGTISQTEAADCNAGMKDSGRLAVGESATFDTTFCSDPTDSLVGQVTWGKKYTADKDIAVIVTSPSGMQIVFNDGPSSSQSFVVFGPLEEGDWTVEVVNVGSRSANYELKVAFG